MKKLKFMLAAATAFGLASALHADDPQFLGSNDFEGFGLNSVITSTTNSNYFALPATAEDGDYQIVAGTPDISRPNNLPSWFTGDRNQVLQLEGGTDPFLCHAKSGAAAVPLTAGDVYVDTLVQFTVTPVGDTVTAQSGDKLMIYLQASTNALGEASTNLMVKAGYCGTGAVMEDGGRDYALTVDSINQVEAGTWYRLTVKVIGNVSTDTNDKYLGFTIALDGHECSVNGATFDDSDDDLIALFGSEYVDDLLAGNIVLSILGADDPTFKSVGFAGSGLVDELVFTTLDPEVTFLSFTLAFDNTSGAFDGGVYYTCGGDSGEVSADGTAVWYGLGTNVVVTYTYDSTAYTYSWSDGTTAAGNDTIVPVAGSTVTLSAEEVQTAVDFTFSFSGSNVSGVIYTVGEESTLYTNEMTSATIAADSVLHIQGFIFAPWYVAAADSAVKVGDSLTISENTNFVVTADSTADGSVPSGTTLADVGISSATGLADADLPKVAAWAATYAGGATAGAIDTVNTMSFVDGVPQNTASEAYLLNTNATAEAVAQAKAEFAFTSFDPTSLPTAADFASKGYNGTVTIQGKETLSAAGWTNLPNDGITPKFFRAILTK